MFAVAYMHVGGKQPGWGIWLANAFPIASVSILCIWLYVVLVKFKSHQGRISPLQQVQETLGVKHYYTIFISIISIALWMANRSLLPWLGGMGLTAIFPMVALFGGGVLGKEDLRLFPWDVVLLAMGGTVLGKAV